MFTLIFPWLYKLAPTKENENIFDFGCSTYTLKKKIEQFKTNGSVIKLYLTVTSYVLQW